MESPIDLRHADCLEIMSDISDGSIDMVMADPPYGTTACKWDSIIPLDPMWEHLKRVTKGNGAIVLMAAQPFTTTLISSNMDMFKYSWVWEKNLKSGYLTAKFMPMRGHEDIVVFYSQTPNYNPLKRLRTDEKKNDNVKIYNSEIYGKKRNEGSRQVDTLPPKDERKGILENIENVNEPNSAISKTKRRV